MGHLNRRTLLAMGLMALPARAFADAKPKAKTLIRRVPTQYIAALATPESKQGTGAENWGWWYKDPGPRGVWLQQYQNLVAAGGVARKGWVFDKTDWWVDENGILMENPVFKIQSGRFIVTGNREAVAVLTIHPRDEKGAMRWELSDDVTIEQVTHLECRAARYTPTALESTCSPADVDQSVFKIKPGQPMPDVRGCKKKDYTVLFVIGVVVDGAS